MSSTLHPDRLFLVCYDVARRMHCVFLSQLVSEHKITLDEAKAILIDLTYNLARDVYKLPLEKVSA